MKNIGIYAILNKNWMGGVNYFISLLSALNIEMTEEFTFFVLTNNKSLLYEDYKPHIKVIQCDYLTDNSDRIRRLCRYFNTDIRLAYYARIYKLDLIVYATPGKRFLPPTLYWMPDFQHQHLPELFSKTEFDAREKTISMVANRSGHLLLSSRSAEKDFRYFYPHLNFVKTHILPFVPNIQINDIFFHKTTQNDTADDFYYIPNQFWQHKNHMIVIEALAILPPEIKVICSGSTTDTRNKLHFSKILARIKELNIENQFVSLGLIKRSEMLALMSRSLAVINPSLFEGWSTTVEEAKYTGKKIILSDIPVHREQAPVDAIYFSPDDSVSLAKAMIQVWEEKEIERKQEMHRLAKSWLELEIQRTRFANRFKATIKNILYTA